jgi:hypothetical protein
VSCACPAYWRASTTPRRSTGCMRILRTGSARRSRPWGQAVCRSARHLTRHAMAGSTCSLAGANWPGWRCVGACGTGGRCPWCMPVFGWAALWTRPSRRSTSSKAGLACRVATGPMPA